MNKDWTDFLISNDATVTPGKEIEFPGKQPAPDPSITPVTHLAIVKITGKNASQFLQGQLTCNIKELTESSSFFTAFCNAKGRAICTFLIIKNNNDYFIILPTELTDKVISKLKMYVLRSDVQINNISDELCLIGLTTSNPSLLPSLPENRFSVKQSTIKLPSKDHRYLMINPTADSTLLWSQLLQNQHTTPVNSNTWRYQDISAGLPWLTLETSEEYIPQMLNIDKLGGISFNKGCYTGQEIVARTHYLGKAKRELFLAECHPTAMLESNCQIFKSDSEQSAGKILSIQSNDQNTRMLIVLQNSDAELQNLTLNNPNKDKISIIDFQ